MRPSTPPLALISSAASCAACGIDAPAMAWASAMTPILMGSAANAELAPSPRAVAARRARNDQELRCDILIVMIDSFVFRPPMGPGLVDQPQIDCSVVDELGKRSEVSIKQGPAAGRSPSWLKHCGAVPENLIFSRIKRNCDSRHRPAV